MGSQEVWKIVKKKLNSIGEVIFVLFFLLNLCSLKYLTEAEDIKKRWQEYTEELYKKDLHDTDNHDGVIIHLEPHSLECEVKRALGSITMNKAS